MLKNVISVVAPVYNVEKYLPEFLDSVVNQTYRYLQIILVDDGSTDNSGVICEEYAKKDSRITVIHQNNAGAGAAKNAGLELVQGEFLSIVDSDDYLELNMYEKMIEHLKCGHVEVVQCLYSNHYRYEDESVSYVLNPGENRKLTAHQFLSEYTLDWKYVLFWNKLFSTSLLKDIRFPEGRKIDDEYFTYKLIGNANSVLNVNDILYHYRLRKSSVMNNNMLQELYHNRAECFLERYKYIIKRFPDLSDTYYRHMSDSFLFFKNQMNSQDEYLNDLANQYPIKRDSFFHRLKSKLIRVKSTNQAVDQPKSFEMFD